MIAQIWNEIVIAMDAAGRAETSAGLRKRFNANLSDKDRAIENMKAKRYATGQWYIAKEIYCRHRDAIVKYMTDHKDYVEYYGYYEIMERILDQDYHDALEKELSASNRPKS